MFFSHDLLSKRDSGFGLLWLAATIGSKSAFKKLPKRSVMTADISQLCQLIATPAEPLALRLSSNLLVGAARYVTITNKAFTKTRSAFSVYRVKQEILMSDVTTCYNSLKRVEQEFRSMSSSEAQLQMAQPSVKSSAVTLRADPWAALSMEFDAMITHWDEFLNQRGSGDAEDDSDNDYHPRTTNVKKKAVEASSNSEFLRATACTLPENHDFLLANSFDASFGGSGTMKPSSSQIGGFGFDDTFDGLDIEEGVGDDLVRELGEGWGASPIRENVEEGLTEVLDPFITDFGTGNLDDGMAGHDVFMQDTPNPQPEEPTNSIQGLHINSVGSPTPPSLAGGINQPAGLAAQRAGRVPNQQADGVVMRKAKRTKPMLDVRTELTDEELKATRTCYLDRQNVIRFELELKKFEKKQVDLIQGLLWDAPGSVHAKELVDFWVDRFKAHVEARSGLFVDPQYDSPPRKRQKVSTSSLKPHTEEIEETHVPVTANWRADQGTIQPIDDDEMIDFNYGSDANWGDVDDYITNVKNQRSSEEPGQARRVSHSLQTFGDIIAVDTVVSDTFHSQHSALFPWDMAGNSSSISAREGGMRPPSNDRISVEYADAKLRGSSASRRGSSVPSLPGSLQAGIVSPVVDLHMVQSDDDFAFDVPGGDRAMEPRQSELNRETLEKNSYNFLEYAKMQYKSLPSAQYLVFDDVVPKATSTARVAATALYHCLVLATKDLLRMKQEEAYGRIEIRIV